MVRVDQAGSTIESGLEDLTLMKTAGSAFRGFPRDEYTTLAETDDRLMASRLSATWRYGAPPDDYDATFDDVCRTLFDAFSGHRSPSVQATIWILGRAVLEAQPSIDEISMTMPNLHHWLVDLAPFGQANDREIFVATSEPYGLIQATIRRSEVAAEPAPVFVEAVPVVAEPEPVAEAVPLVAAPEPEPVAEPELVGEPESTPEASGVAAVAAAGALASEREPADEPARDHEPAVLAAATVVAAVVGPTADQPRT